MGNSIQAIRDDHEMFLDSRLALLSQMFVEEIRTRESDYPSLLGHAAEWAEYSDGFGVGCIDLDLEPVAEDEASRLQFLAVLDTVEQQLKELGPFLSPDLIHSRWKTKGLRFLASQSVMELVADVHRLGDFVKRNG